jgi:hypothetical protein
MEEEDENSEAVTLSLNIHEEIMMMIAKYTSQNRFSEEICFALSIVAIAYTINSIAHSFNMKDFPIVLEKLIAIAEKIHREQKFTKMIIFKHGKKISEEIIDIKPH